MERMLAFDGPGGSNILIRSSVGGDTVPAWVEEETLRGERVRHARWTDALGSHEVIVRGVEGISDEARSDDTLDRALDTGRWLTRPVWLLTADHLVQACADARVEAPPGLLRDEPGAPGREAALPEGVDGQDQDPGSAALLSLALRTLMGPGGSAARITVTWPGLVESTLYGSHAGLVAALSSGPGATHLLTLLPEEVAVALALRDLRLTPASRGELEHASEPTRVEVVAMQVVNGSVASLTSTWDDLGADGFTRPTAADPATGGLPRTSMDELASDVRSAISGR